MNIEFRKTIKILHIKNLKINWKHGARSYIVAHNLHLLPLSCLHGTFETYPRGGHNLWHASWVPNSYRHPGSIQAKTLNFQICQETWWIARSFLLRTILRRVALSPVDKILIRKFTRLWPSPKTIQKWVEKKLDG